MLENLDQLVNFIKLLKQISCQVCSGRCFCSTSNQLDEFDQLYFASAVHLLPPVALGKIGNIKISPEFFFVMQVFDPRGWDKHYHH